MRELQSEISLRESNSGHSIRNPMPRLWGRPG